MVLPAMRKAVQTREETMKLTTLKNRVMAFVREEDGATAIEYALIAALIAIAIVTALSSAGASITKLFEDVAKTIGGTSGTGGTGGTDGGT